MDQADEIPQYLVSSNVPPGVVDPLEVIEIQHQQRAGAFVASSPGPLRIEPVIEVAPVARMSEGIASRPLVQLRSHLLLQSVMEGKAQQDGGSQANRVAVPERERFGHPLAATESPIGRSEILQRVGAVVFGDSRMLAGHAWYGQLQIDVFGAPDQRSARGQP